MKKAILFAVIMSVVLTAAFAGGSGETKAKPAEPTVLRYAHMNAPMSAAGKQATLLAQKVEEMTKGMVKIQVYPASQLGTLQEQAEAVSTGSVAIHHNTMAAIGSLYPDFAALDTPFMYKDVDELMKVTDPQSPVMKKLNDGLLASRGVRVYYTFYFGTRHLTSNRAIYKPADLRGLKIRAIPFPIYMAAVDGMGAVATPVDFAELPTALATGIVAGQENPTDTIFASKLYERQSHLMLTGHIKGAEIVVFNDKVWKGLSSDMQKALGAAAAEVSKAGTQLTKDSENEALGELKKKGMTVIGPAEGLDVEAFRAQVQSHVKAKFESQFGHVYADIRAMLK